MLTAGQSFRAGVRALAPLLIGSVPFGMIYGVTASGVGIPPAESMTMAVFVLAGAAQLACIQLMDAGSPLAVVLLTGLVINLRFLMYSASLAPHLAGHGPLRKGLAAYLLTDQAYAVSITRYADARRPVDKLWFYLGGGMMVWAGWLTGAMAGAVLGAAIPSEVPLGLAVPLTFMALMVPVLTDRPKLLAALISGAVAVAANTLPYNLGLVLGAASGITAGCLMEGRRS